MQRKLTNIFKSAVSSVNPGNLIRTGIVINNTEVNIFGNIFNINTNYHVIGFGKAVSSMTSSLQDILQHRIKSGVISVPVNSTAKTHPLIRVFYGASNNLPDSASIDATNEILRLAENVPSNDVVIILVSGGGSTLFCKPVEGITTQDKTNIVKLLTKCGADIQELNTVRKKLSAVKGGKLGYFLNKNTTVSLILSDIIGDPLELIASGPTVLNTDSPYAALDVIKKYKLELKIPKHVLNIIGKPHDDNIKLGNVTNVLIGSNKIAMESAIQTETTDVCKIFSLCSDINGLVTDVTLWYLKISEAILKFLHDDNARAFYDAIRVVLRERNFNNNIIAELMLSLKDKKVNMVCLLMGGETTVKLEGTGKGGRNQELSVLFAQSIHKLYINKPSLFKKWDVSLLSAGTDGIDGPTDAAGGIGCVELIAKAQKAGLNVDSFLANNDTYTFLSQIENGKYLVKIGHTGTNVMDIHILGFSRKLLEISKM